MKKNHLICPVRRALLIFSLLFFSVPFLFSMDWPMPLEGAVKNFGWNDRGQPHLGVTFGGESEIFAAESGELLFYRRQDDIASRLPSPLGSWAALDHGDGIISIYSRYEDLSFSERYSAAVPGYVFKGAALGTGGISGWSSAKGLYFSLFDRKERRWINPSMIITPPDSALPPAILSVRLRDDQGRAFDPAQTRNLSQGRYVILVDAITGSVNAPLAPYRIICSLNGSELGVLNFETYYARSGSLVVNRNGLIPVRQIYATVPGYEVANVWLTRGQATIEIIAQNIMGASRSVVYRLTVE